MVVFGVAWSRGLVLPIYQPSGQAATVLPISWIKQGFTSWLLPLSWGTADGFWGTLLLVFELVTTFIYPFHALARELVY